MAKYPRPTRDEWIQPIMKQYRMACCDCGLVHQMRFRVIVELPRKKGKLWKVLLQRVIKHKVQFKAERHERATAAMRRPFETIRVIKGPKAKTR